MKHFALWSLASSPHRIITLYYLHCHLFVILDKTLTAHLHCAGAQFPSPPSRFYRKYIFGHIHHRQSSLSRSQVSVCLRRLPSSKRVKADLITSRARASRHFNIQVLRVKSFFFLLFYFKVKNPLIYWSLCVKRWHYWVFCKILRYYMENTQTSDAKAYFNIGYYIF